MTSSAILLADIVERYRMAYLKDLGRKPSLREISDLIGIDKSSLSRWTGVDATEYRRVPLHQIPVLTVALMMTKDEVDTLMEARIGEQIDADPTIKIACEWLADFMNRAHQLDQDEQVILKTYKELTKKYPRGLHLDVDELDLIKDGMARILQRADKAWLEHDNVNDCTEVIPSNEAYKLKLKMKKSAPNVSPFKQAIRHAKLLTTGKSVVY